MSSRPKLLSVLPAIRRDYEGSRLEAQQLVSAYECVVPVLRRPLTNHRGSRHVVGPPGDHAVIRKAIGGAHQ
jgi:hypothetical protein